MWYCSQAATDEIVMMTHAGPEEERNRAGIYSLTALKLFQ
jgi:hypothetical protein